MADRYFDLNGSTAGFYILTGPWNTTSAFWSTSSAGTAVPATFTFTSADRAFFGAAGATATAGTATIADGVTVTLNGITTANLAGLQTIARSISGALTLAGTAPSITVNSAGGVTISAPIGGTTAWTSNGSNTLTLTAANGFSAGMTIASGVVQAGNNSALGTNTVTMIGGKLSSDGTTGYTLANAFSLSGSVTLTDSINTGTLTLTGDMTVSSTTSVSIVQANNIVDLQGSLKGSGALTHTAGQLFLNKATGNTFSGTVTINGGILYLGRDTTLPNQLGGGATLSTIALTTGSLYFGGTSAYQVDNTITSPSNANSILYGRTRNTTTGLTFTGLSGFQGSVRVYATSLDGAIASQTVTMTVFPTGAANFRFQQSNTVTMTQTLKYTGSANVSSVSPIVMTAATNTLDAVWYHAPLNGTATMDMIGGASSSTTQTHSFELKNDSSGALTLSGGIDQQGAGVLSLKKTGTGPVSVSGTGTFTGTVSITAGTFNANSATALGADTSGVGAVSVSLGATLSLGFAANYPIARSLALQGTGSSSTPNNGALIIANAGTNTFAGITLGSSTLIRGTVTGGTLAGNISNGANTLTLGANTGVTFSVSGVIGSGAGGLTVDNGTGQTGTVFLSQTDSTFLGQFVVVNGDVAVAKLANNGATSSIGSGSSAIKIGSGTNLANFVWRPSGASAVTQTTNKSFDFAGTTGTVNIRVSGFAPAGSTITFSGGTATFSVAGARTITFGPFTGTSIVWGIALGDSSAGATSIACDRGGTTTLNTANTYSGGTSIGVGTIRAGNTQALGTTGTVTLTVSGATLETLTTGGQNGKLTVGSLTNSAGGIIKIGG